MTVVSTDQTAFYELLYNPKYTPKRSLKAHVEEMTIDGEPKLIMIKEPAEYFEIDETTNTIWNRLDGNKTISQLAEDLRKVDEKIDEKEVKDTVLSLAQEGFIETTEPEIEEKRIRLESAFQLDISLLRDASVSLAGFFKVTRKLIHRAELPITLAISALGIALAFSSMVQIMSDPTKLELAGSTLLGLFFYEEIVLLPVFLIHELAHAATCDYFGAKPREIGTGFYYFAPFFYVDTSDSWRLGRNARIMISLAGPLSTLVMGSIFTFVSLRPNLGFVETVLQVASFFCFYGTLINLSPVIETDGYYVVSDVLKMPNLRDESFAYIKRSILRLFKRPIKKVRYGASKRRILLIYSIISVAWLGFFAYTTLRLTYFYSLSAYQALNLLFQTATRAISFSFANLGIGIGSLLYFILLIFGYFMMGVIAYRKISVRGTKLETIHDKRVTIFLPLPVFIRRDRALQLVDQAKRVSRRFTRTISVIWEAPLCVVALKLGKVDQSLNDLKQDIASIEKTFRSLHSRFLSRGLKATSLSEDSNGKIRQLLASLVAEFPSSEKREASNELSKFLDNTPKMLMRVLESGFGDLWTLELPPDDYKRIRKELIQGPLGGEIGSLDLDAELEHFKRHTVLGLDALAKLYSDLGKETNLATRNLERFQATVLVEPIRSRLVFIGRTEGIERSISWIGGLFLYQAWIGYLGEVLLESAIELRSINQIKYGLSGKSQIEKLSNGELKVLYESYKQVELVRESMVEALGRIKSSYQSAKNLHDALTTTLEDQNFDIGSYKPMISTDEEHMASLNDKIAMFEEELQRAYDRFEKTSMLLGEAFQKKQGESEQETLVQKLKISLRLDKERRSSAYYAEVKYLYATVRLFYDVAGQSNIVL